VIAAHQRGFQDTANPFISNSYCGSMRVINATV
jgi:hypothetical protein